MRQFILILAIAVTATSCNSANSKERKAEAIAQQRSLDSMQMEIARQQIVDSMNEATATAAAATAAATKTQRTNTRTRVETRTVYVNNGSQPATIVAEQPATEKERKGWSAKAKGAVIGAGAGAITGAMVSEKKGKGAIIGGVIGAGAGLGAGAIIDNKQGR